jgi:hypothetical protein
MNALAGKFIGDQNRAVIVEAPEKDKATLPTEATLLQWIAPPGKASPLMLIMYHQSHYWANCPKAPR